MRIIYNYSDEVNLNPDLRSFDKAIKRGRPDYNKKAITGINGSNFRLHPVLSVNKALRLRECKYEKFDKLIYLSVLKSMVLC